MARAALIALLCAGCYTPRFAACTVECAADRSCPTGLTCAADNFCHDEKSPGALCTLDQGDGGADLE